MPTEEQKVLATSANDVVAILKSNTVLRGIFNDKRKSVGLNMRSGAVFELAPELISETPLGYKFPIPKNFEVVHLNQ